MASIGTTELIPLHGDLSSAWLPLAANQSGTSRIYPGDPVRLVNGLVTRCAVNGAAFDTDTQWIGIADFNSVVTVRGTVTALAAGTFVKVILITSNVVMDLPTKAGTDPTLATHIVSGANSTGYALYMSSTGQLQVDLGTTNKAMVRPFGFPLMDWKDSDGTSIKSTTAGSAGDRVCCAPLNAGLQVII